MIGTNLAHKKFHEIRIKQSGRDKYIVKSNDGHNVTVWYKRLVKWVNKQKVNEFRHYYSKP